MIPTATNDAFNQQINEEIYSAYLYLSMAAYFEAQNLEGFAHWMKKQAAEEMEHAMKFFAHISERGGRVKLDAINQPQVDWDSPQAAFTDAAMHEQHISSRIHSLLKKAMDEADYAALPMLHWFVAEQIEEEDSVQKIAERLALIGDKGNGIFMLDRELAGR